MAKNIVQEVLFKKTVPNALYDLYMNSKKHYMIHTNLPEKQADSINKGWHVHYWEPWKKYLAGKPIAKSPTM
jgi:hypothetical protein